MTSATQAYIADPIMNESGSSKRVNTGAPTISHVKTGLGVIIYQDRLASASHIIRSKIIMKFNFVVVLISYVAQQSEELEMVKTIAQKI